MPRLSALIVAVSLCALAVAACDRKPDAAAPAGPAPATIAAPVKAAKPAAPALRDAAGKLTKAGMHAVWQEIFMGAAAANQPIEKKMEAFEAKVGKPAKVEKDTKVWFAVDGATCHRVEIGKDGTEGVELVPPANCGG
jgi:hypothetical protein